jgi:hypothetical protein
MNINDKLLVKNSLLITFSYGCVVQWWDEAAWSKNGL